MGEIILASDSFKLVITYNPLTLGIFTVASLGVGASGVYAYIMSRRLRDKTHDYQSRFDFYKDTIRIVHPKKAYKS